MKRDTSRFDVLEASLLSAGLLAYSNGLTMWAERRGEMPEDFFRRYNRAFIWLLLVYTALRPGGFRAVGLRTAGLGSSLLWGLGLGLGLAVPPLLFFFRPYLLHTPLVYDPLTRFSRRQLIYDLLVSVPIGTALLEELSFRGLLYGALRRRFSTAVALVASSAVFAGWHYKTTVTTTGQTNLAAAARLPRFLMPYVQPLAIIGGLLTTGVAGAIFGLLRERTGNLWGSIVAHWIVDGIMIAALWIKRPPSSVEV